MRTFQLCVKTIMFAIVLCSCSDGVVGDDPKNNPNIQLKSSFSSIQQEVFNVHCVSCHSGVAPNGNLDLSAGLAYANIINIQNAGKFAVYIKPGNVEQSYLYSRLTSSSSPMPPTGKLAQNVLDTIKVWIEQGALNN